MEPLGTTWEMMNWELFHKAKAYGIKFKGTHVIGHMRTMRTTKGKLMCQTYADKIWAIHGEKFGKTCTTTTTMVRTCTIDSLLT